MRFVNHAWTRFTERLRVLRAQKPWLFFGMVLLPLLLIGGAGGGLVVSSQPSFCAKCQLLIGGAGGGLVVSSQPSFCAKCHEMTPEVKTWSASAHSKFSCKECHVAARPTNLTHKMSALVQVYLHVTDQVPATIVIKDKIENKVCEECHNKQRQVSASGDLKVPHAKHIDVEGMTCVDCHAGIAHGGISKRSQDLAHASHEQIAKAVNLEAKEFRPSMVSCIGCHNQKNVSISCESCHKEIKTPASHKKTEWKFKHGKDGLETYNECLFCHDIAKGKPAVAEIRPITAIRDNDFCLGCHLTRPPEHNDSWALGHRKVAQADKTSCAVCHDETRIAGSPVEKVPTCNKCHNSNHNSTWIKEHPKVVKQNGLGECFRCHDAKSCATCHAKNGVDRK